MASVVVRVLVALCLGVFAGCEDERRIRRCEPGVTIACSCTDAAVGTQRCGADGLLQACVCGDPDAVQCEPGERDACLCLNGAESERTCNAAGYYDACACDGGGGTAALDGAGGSPDPDPVCDAPLDTDGDGMTDCEEATDGSDFSDPAQFNGLRARLLPSCGAMSCARLEDPAAVDACIGPGGTAPQWQAAGWDFGSAADGDSCAADYGFSPPFEAACAQQFAVLWEGRISLEAGTHCFFVGPGLAGGCGVLQLARGRGFAGWQAASPGDVLAVHGDLGAEFVDGGLSCGRFEAGVYPIRLFFNTWDDPHAFRVRHCYTPQSNGACAPGTPLSAVRLQPDPL